MKKQSKESIVLFSVLFISSCSGSIDRSLSPPSDTQWVKVEVKNPSLYTRPFPLKVVYISHKCLKRRISGVDGSQIKEPSYYGINMPLEQQGSSNVWQTKVAMLGGGRCHWTLSEFTMGIGYIDATHLGKDLVPGTNVGATIAFDSDATRNGQFSTLPGNGILAPKYYPYITERNINEKQKYLSLLGKEDFLMYRNFNSENIFFSPEIDERKVVRFVEPEKKVDGVYPKIIYPDGTLAPDDVLFPDFNKVDGMSVK
ncbi:hypothetical protein [Intestinirhabdus alba]|jgi:hypothetical protein|uniref:Lipoprotein n=1 Tax=Intestinirhabdus alba TaxID=2899544 RepID=A0A6L6IPS7_9ENTR|nr:hypothetical protein [Intestinirhabdus alba]MTH48862.1 hypothetical protein [Intestinirhabdus alba]